MPATLVDLSRRLHDLHGALLSAEQSASAQLAAVAEDQRASARNLVHYLALRNHDLRDLQRDLSAYGLSSLGRMEAAVLPGLEEVMETVDALAQARPRRNPLPEASHAALLQRDTDLLLGRAPASRGTRIMVTMPSQAAEDPALVEEMTDAGMDIARVNCAHDGPEEWAAMIRHVRDAAGRRRRHGLVAMDLGGPKLRTGPVGGKGHLALHTGDHLILTASLEEGATIDGIHRVGCTLPQALVDVRVGHRILFDDGKVASQVVDVRDGEVEVLITRAGPAGAKLRAEKGINLPDTEIDVPALTKEDREALRFVAQHADLVSLSFARSPRDVADLVDELQQLDAHCGIVLKVETRSGFESLPAMLLQAMRVGPVAVMIARGDLAVEVGFERLAEVQEEMLWLCEAAHCPAIWATQVLDTFAKKGMPSRSEVTDAAMGRRAECVMLNKGPFIVDAIRGLDSILARMGGHVDKKRSLLRRLRAWDESREADGE